MSKVQPIPGSEKVRKRPVPKARILVVDDDERNLLALSEVLKDLAQVVTATSGRDALRLLLKGEFAVILLDVFMPGMDGYETAGLIREREQTARIPIIFLSAVNKETEHLMRGYSMGAVDYVFKPVDPLILKSKVSVFVDLYNMRVQVAETSRAEQESRDANYKAQLERLQLAQELRATLERQGAILAALPMALYEAVLDDQGGLARKFVGGDISNLTGLSSDDLDAEPWEGRIHPDDKLRVSAPDADEMQPRHAMEYRWIGPDNVSRHFLDQRVRISGDAQGARWAGTLVDITEQKLLEAQLLHARKMDAIGQLTGGVAHDFNNLLSAVLGGIHLLERRMHLGERDQLILQQMRHAAEQGAELVRRMMAFARKQDLSPTSVDPRSLCQSVAGLIEHTLAGTVSIIWACADEVPNLFVDRAQLELAMVNLIINARDAMPQGGQIDISIDAIDLDGMESTRVRVSDQGEGIPDELIGRITEPFFTTKEAGKGTGLGLSMVAGFVQQSGGRLVIDSEPGKGTTIDLILPSTAQPTAIADNSIGEAPRVAPSSRTVLLVDDDEAVRTVLAEQLREVGFRVDIATDGNSAISRLESDDGYDVLLTDFAMPGMNGLDTIRKAVGKRPSIQPLLMTGYADEDAVAAIRDDVPVIRKPINLDELVRELSAGQKTVDR